MEHKMKTLANVRMAKFFFLFLIAFISVISHMMAKPGVGTE